MKLFSPVFMENNRKMELYSMCMENSKQMELYSSGCMENNNQMELYSMVYGK
jgi:hypothetical protein